MGCLRSLAFLKSDSGGELRPATTQFPVRSVYPGSVGERRVFSGDGSWADNGGRRQARLERGWGLAVAGLECQRRAGAGLRVPLDLGARV